MRVVKMKLSQTILGFYDLADFVYKVFRIRKWGFYNEEYSSNWYCFECPPFDFLPYWMVKKLPHWWWEPVKLWEVKKDRMYLEDE